ncbi:MAG: membrane protein insertion efficiency factor YidD [Phycisphaeraceae bacterium]|nr:MAG: membrane protein insertion efficiency factor YidD [Phycisphaeraceae bacterium]
MRDPASPTDSQLGRSRAGRLAAAPFIFAVRMYQATLGQLVGGRCRFSPSCSEYAIEAYRAHNPLRATWLAARRLLRCHPFGGSGYDPVPERRSRASD